MADVDTSAEAVERLACYLCARWDDEWALLDCRINAAATLRALLARAERAEAVLLAVADATATEGVDVGVLLARIGMVTQSFRDAALLNITNMTDEDMRALFLAAPHVPVDAEINALVADNARLLDSVTAESEARVKAEAERDALREALLFYGGHDPDNSDHGEWVERMNEDGGDVARAALNPSTGDDA